MALAQFEKSVRNYASRASILEIMSSIASLGRPTGELEEQVKILKIKY